MNATTLEVNNDYNKGYEEAVNDVFIAFADILDNVKDDNTYHSLMRYYTLLSGKFPRKFSEEE
jgi:hypothetical protein